MITFVERFSNPFFYNDFNMKNLILILASLCINCYTFSQASFGIKTGLNLSHAKYLDDADDQMVKQYRKLKPGFVAGFVLNMQLNKVLSVQAEILYSQKGLKFEQIPYNKTINSMNYIELPISGHYNLHRSKSTAFDVYIGAYGAYWIDGKSKKDDLTTGELSVDKVDFQNQDYKYNRIDVGILSGIVYKVKKTSYFLRYTHSMTGSSQINADALTNRLVSFGINILFVD